MAAAVFFLGFVDDGSDDVVPLVAVSSSSRRFRRLISVLSFVISCNEQATYSRWAPDS